MKLINMSQSFLISHINYQIVDILMQVASIFIRLLQRNTLNLHVCHLSVHPTNY